MSRRRAVLRANGVVCDPSDDPIAVRLRGLNTVVSSEGVPRHCAIAPFIDYHPGLGFTMRADTTHFRVSWNVKYLVQICKI